MKKGDFLKFKANRIRGNSLFSNWLKFETEAFLKISNKKNTKSPIFENKFQKKICQRNFKANILEEKFQRKQSSEKNLLKKIFLKKNFEKKIFLEEKFKKKIWKEKIP